MSDPENSEDDFEEQPNLLNASIRESYASKK